ncbi:MAG: hypothetical protein OSB82_06805 [Alphaproteobacteria bacterium]|nr:hypothetical protein [Alphaproteobacteria bacterium]
MAIALAPAIGPVVGGHMHVWFGWRSNFVLLPETLVKPDRHALRPGRIFGGYYTLLRDGPFMTYTLIMSLVLGGLFATIAEFPFLFIERLGVPTDQYGYYYATIALDFFLGSLAVNRAAGHVNSDKLLAAGLVLGVLAKPSLLACWRRVGTMPPPVRSPSPPANACSPLAWA